MVLRGLLTAAVGLTWCGTIHASVFSEALLVGNCEAAMSNPPANLTDAERLGLGRCQLSSGLPNEALHDLEQVHAPSKLFPYAQLLRGEAALDLGNPKVAVPMLQFAMNQLSGEPQDRARMWLGRAQIEIGDYAAGRDTLRPLLESNIGSAGFVPSPGGADPAIIRWWLAEGAVRRGDASLAIPVWQAIWTKNPTHLLAEKASANLSQAGVAVPDPSNQAGLQLMQSRIKTLDKRHQYVESLALRQSLPASHPQRSAKKLAYAAFKAKDYPLALGFFADIASPTPADLFSHALATSRTGDYDTAARLYYDLATRFPTHEKADFASFKLGYLRFDKKDYLAATQQFDEHLRRFPNSQHRQEAQWFTAWSWVQLQEWKQATASLQKLLSAYANGPMAPAALYWITRIAGLQGEPEEEGYREVMRRWPTSGYAFFSSKRLGIVYPTKNIPELTPDTSITSHPDYTTGLALARVGLDDWARGALLPLVSQAKKNGPQARLTLGTALQEAGAYTTAKAMATPYCGAPGDPASIPGAEALCWPRPSGNVVSDMAIQGQLAHQLPFAIMTAESALKPWVTSPAGARGLMQLMPSLGEQHHRQIYSQTPYDPNLLYQAGYNAFLGTRELVALNRHFQNTTIQPSLPLVIAGYNGGQDAVSNWITQMPTWAPNEGDLFTENIGYTETRRYVRRVLGYLQTYRLVYGDPTI